MNREFSRFPGYIKGSGAFCILASIMLFLVMTTTSCGGGTTGIQSAIGYGSAVGDSQEDFPQVEEMQDRPGFVGGASNANWEEIDLGEGLTFRYKSDAVLTAHLDLACNPVPTVTVESASAQEISYLTAELLLGNTRFFASETRFDGALSSADIRLSLTDLPDRAAIGAAYANLQSRGCARGEKIAVINLEKGAPRRISQSVYRIPQGEDNKVMNLNTQWDDINQLLNVSFRGRVIGDYDQSGEVGIPDITPVALYFGIAVGSVLDVVDGDMSGEIGIPDITPIANNYLTLLTGWNLYLGIDDGSGNYSYTKIGTSTPTIARREADISDRLNSYVLGIPLGDYGSYRVRVVPVGEGGNEAGSETYAEYDYEYSPPVPPAPENQHLTGLDLDYATVSWDEITSPIVSKVCCWKSETGGTDLGNYVLDATYDTVPFPTSHTFSDLTPLTDYYFIITTVSNEDIESAVPTPVEAYTETPPNPPAPANQSITDVTPNSATASWDDPSDPLIAEIYCWKSTTGGTNLADYTLDATYSTLPLPTEHTFSGLDTSTQYYFAITSKSPLSRESGVETVLEAYTSNPPTAVIDGPEQMLKGYESPTYGVFSGDGSTDPDPGDTIAEYRWNWDDGSPEEVTHQPTIVHNNWAAAGNYDVTLTVVDSHGVASAPIPQTVEVINGRNDILVVYNTNETYIDSWTMTIHEMSQAVAEYYMDIETGRGIAPANVVGFDWNDPAIGDTGASIEIVTRDYYTNTIRADLEAFLTDSGLKNTISYIVLCKGVPLKINRASGTDYNTYDEASVDSELCLLFETYNIGGRPDNAFYATHTPVAQPFEPFTYSYGGLTLSYLVARLDAYTLDEVKLIVDRSKSATGNTDGWVILDDESGKNYDMMCRPIAQELRSSAEEVLTDYGANLFADNTNSFVNRTFINDDSISQNVVGFCGHGIHAAEDPGVEYILTGLDFAYRPGAMFISYESFNGYSFFSPESRAGQGLIADFIRMGGTCGIGNVFEPLSDACGDESVAFVQYLKGDNSVEALYRSLRYVSWVEVVIGDPLCYITD